MAENYLLDQMPIIIDNFRIDFGTAVIENAVNPKDDEDSIQSTASGENVVVSQINNKGVKIRITVLPGEGRRELLEKKIDSYIADAKKFGFKRKLTLNWSIPAWNRQIFSSDAFFARVETIGDIFTSETKQEILITCANIDEKSIN